MEKENNKQQNKAQNKDIEEDEINLSKNQVILYIFIIAGAITIFILSMIGINPFILLIIIGAVLVYVYFDRDILEEDSIDSIPNEKLE
ncbi:MAG: hypothetical protein ACFFAH_07545 [Promethearchaeota archaeon]